MLSVDTKKKEFLGGIYRDGTLYCKVGESLIRFDHDFPYLAEGRMIPHGIYDTALNKGFITLGTSAETPAFVAECLRKWWNYQGHYDYPGCWRLLLLMDGGGANSHRVHQFKREMIKLATWIGLEIRIAHYPPYCSKWNPIEHQLFPHVTRSLQGVCLDSAETMKTYINERANTTTGLVTKAYILDKKFEYGYKDDEPLPDGFPLVTSDKLPKWNYTCYPSSEYVNRLLN